MVPEAVLPPDAERAVGLEFYASATPGAGGAIKERSYDFRVREISAYPVPDPQGPFTILRIVSRDWEQHELAQRISARLGLPSNAIDWAGTKDRRAVAERLMSYRGPLPGPIDLPRVEIVEAYSARSGLVLGHHYGNAFEIRVPFGPVGEAEARVRWESTLAELRAAGGFPNLFGLQRFGEVRPVTHDVGRWLVRGDVAVAVETYLTAMPDGPNGQGAEARRSYAEHHDAVRALREFPPAFRFERQLLDHLSRGNPPERALRGLSRELRMLFVHAFQSLIFNRWVSARHAAGISLVEPEPGDFLLRLARDGTLPGTNSIPVSSDNLPESIELVRRGRAQLAGPLVGFETPASQGRPGEILELLLREERVTRADFRLPKAPEVSSRGSYRPVTLPPPPVAIRVRDPSSEGGEREPGAWFIFSLPKGAYATILMREFTKIGAEPRPNDDPSDRAF